MTDAGQKLTTEQLEILKQATVFTQAQVQYTTLSPKDNQACANCVFYRSTAFDGIEYPHCLIVESSYPDPIEPTGLCNHWEAKPEPPATVAEEVAEAVTDAVAEAVETVAEVVAVSAEHPKKTVLQRAREALFPPRENGDFNVFKGSDGQWYWIAKYTNAYVDKEGEIFTEKAHEDYIRRVDMGLVDKPELWVWHTKGTKHGQADVVFGVGRIVVAVGHFDDTPAAKKAIQFYQKNAAKIKLSHGALAPKWAIKNGVIDAYNTFEISVLPKGAESNPYTSYEAVKSMQPDPKKLDWVATILGKEKAEAIVTETTTFSKSLDEMEVRYKDFAQVSQTPSEQPTEAQKNMSEAFVDMVKDFGKTIGLLEAMEKRQDETDNLVKLLKTQNETYEKEVTGLRTLVNAGPRRPSQDKGTEAPDTLVEKSKDALPNDEAKEFESRYGAPMKKEASPNGHG